MYKFKWINWTLVPLSLAGCFSSKEEAFESTAYETSVSFLDYRKRGEGREISGYFDEYIPYFHTQFLSETYAPLSYRVIDSGIEDRLEEKYYFIEYRVDYKSGISVREYYSFSLESNGSKSQGIVVYHDNKEDGEELHRLYKAESESRGF